MSGNSTIAKNTLFLYVRMAISMVVSFYTSRVLLQVLGVDDYGIYQAVGGIVGFLGFINGALGTGTSRYLTVSLGGGNMEKMKQMFSMAFYIHLGIGLLIALVAETGGYWFLTNKMVIPPERMWGAKIVFHVSIISTLLNVSQVPYYACLIAHEKINIVAYSGIVETLLKLLVVYLLVIIDFDKMALCAILYFLLSLGFILFYRIYCIRNFEEVQHKFQYDKSLLKEFLGFSGWSLFSNITMALTGKGILLLMNMFFPPAVIAARSISLQVNGAAGQLVNNFQTAANPQIVKKYAAGDLGGSKHLLLQTTKFSYYIMLITCVPIFFTAERLLRIWLGVVPEYSVIFLQLAMAQSLASIFDISFYKALYAKGRLKENAILSPGVAFLIFPVSYLLFKTGFSPVSLSWVSLIAYVIIGFVVKPVLLVRICDYSWSEILPVFKTCIRVTLLSIPLPLFCMGLFEDSGLFLGFLAMASISIVSAAISCWFFGVEKQMRQYLTGILKDKLQQKVWRR